MDLITTAQAAEILGVKPRTLQRMVKSGRLTPALTLASGYLFDADVIDQLAQKRRAGAGEVA